MPDDAVAASEFDSPIERVSIDKLPMDTIISMLEGIRARRLVLAERAASIHEAKATARHGVLLERYNKLHARLLASLAKIDDSLTKADVVLNKLRALDLEMEDLHEGV